MVSVESVFVPGPLGTGSHQEDGVSKIPNTNPFLVVPPSIFSFSSQTMRSYVVFLLKLWIDVTIRILCTHCIDRSTRYYTWSIFLDSYFVGKRRDLRAIAYSFISGLLPN